MEQKKKYLHLDLKGIVPAFPRFCQWLEYFASLGFAGIVLECDCRIPWKCWEGAGEYFYTKEEIVSLTEYAEKLHLEVIPLIQVQGHMEWVLKEEKYASLRENAFYNDLCPTHPISVEKLKEWIDETVALFPHAEKIHLGGDEAWHLGSCPLCQEKIGNDPLQRGKMGLFADHVSLLANYAKDKYALQVLLWDDMFCKVEDEKILELLFAKFPPDTIYVHWKYQGDIQNDLEKIRTAKCKVWGASALRCSWQNHFVHALNFVGERVENIRKWEESDLMILHTTWGRPNDLWNPYGPWEALIPEFIAAGRGTAEWDKHPWKTFTEQLDESVKLCDYKKLELSLKEAEKLPCADEWEEQGKKFFILAIQYELLRLEGKSHLEVLRIRNVLKAHGKGDPCGCEKDYAAAREKFRKKTEEWEKVLTLFWQENSLSNLEEYKELRRAEFFPDLLFG